MGYSQKEVIIAYCNSDLLKLMALDQVTPFRQLDSAACIVNYFITNLFPRLIHYVRQQLFYGTWCVDLFIHGVW